MARFIEDGLEWTDDPFECDKCHSRMKVADRSSNCQLLRCPKCGWEVVVGLSNDDYDEIPEGCAACGGPYPDCVSSCNMYED